MSQSSPDNFDLPSPRSGHVASAVDGKMLIWGGFGQFEEYFPAERYAPCDVLWIYDLEDRTWSRYNTSPPPVTGRSGSSCCSHQGKIYVWGGYPHHAKEVHCLDLSSGEWDDRLPAGIQPECRDKFVLWCYQDRMIVFGGFGPEIADAAEDCWVPDPTTYSIWGPHVLRGWNNETYEYDMKHRRWRKISTRGPVPCPRASHAGAVVGNRGFLFGGRFRDVRRNDMHYLDLDTYTWSGSLSIKGPIPEGRSWHSLTPVGPSHLLLCGGFNTQCQPLDDIWLFDTDKFVWTRVECHLPTPRLWHTAVPGADVGEVVIFGGCINNILTLEGDITHTNDVVHISVTAKPLVKLCLQSIRVNINLLRTQITDLPRSLKQKILRPVDSPT